MTKHLSAAVRIQKARTALLLDHPFFGSLFFRGRASNSIQTMATDAVSLFYNLAFVRDAERGRTRRRPGLRGHAPGPSTSHASRRRDRKRWNMACDYAINPLLLDARLTLSKDVLIDYRFRGMSAERIYKLIEEQQDQDGGNGKLDN